MKLGYALLTSLLVLALLAACGSQSPDYQQVAVVKVAVDLGVAPGDMAPLGVPATEGGVTGVTQVELNVYRGGTLVLFDADGNEDAAGSGDVVLDPVAGVGLNLMFGSYEFRVAAGDDADNLLASGSLLHEVAGDVNLQVPLVSEIGSVELVGPAVVQAEQLFDVFLHVMPPGRSDLWVPVTEFVAVYSHPDVTAVGSSGHGIRFDSSASCEPFDLVVQIHRPGAPDEVLASADLSISGDVICPVAPGTIGVDMAPPQLEVGPLPALATVGFEVELTGTVGDAGSGVAGVQVYDGPILIGDAELDLSVSPNTWQLRWTPSTVRDYDLRFLALDNAGNQTTAWFDTEASTHAMFTNVSAGDNHACGLTAAGTAYCWGSNEHGQVGNGTMEDAHRPSKVSGDWRFRQIASGGDFSCGIADTWELVCWGANEFGELGNGTTADSAEPVELDTSLLFAYVTMGLNHACAQSVEGDWYCWGRGDYGQLGDGTTVDSLTPLLVDHLQDFGILVAGGLHTCGLDFDGMAYCWGNGNYGQLGQGFDDPSATPVAVLGGHTFDSLAVGRFHTCGLTAAGEAYCWGVNQFGRLGDNSDTNRNTPVEVLGNRTFQSLAAGVSHTCGLNTAGQAACWGHGTSGQLGDGADSNSFVPVAVGGSLDFTEITAGYWFSCGMMATGQAYCWGEGGSGAIGNGQTTNQSLPVPVVVATPD